MAAKTAAEKETDAAASFLRALTSQWKAAAGDSYPTAAKYQMILSDSFVPPIM